MPPEARRTAAERLGRLLRPRSIAFVGGRSLEQAIRNCEGLGYDGDIWVVNPRYDELAGRPCYPSAANLPAPPDAAFVGVGRDLAVPAVRDLAAVGAGGCVCLAAGFAELGEDGQAHQDALAAAAGPMPLVGPNCYGILNYVDGVALWPDLHGGHRVAEGVALIAQSGNVSLNVTMADRSLDLSHVVSVGNQAVLGTGDYIDALLDDPRVRAIGLYVEGIDDLEGFARAVLRALRQGVPVAAVKVGASPLASDIALGHTGSLARPDRLYRALFERLGMVQVDSLTALLETLKLLVGWRGSGARTLGVLTASGGDAALLADAASRHGLSFPAFSPERAAALTPLVGDLVAVDNPLDYNAAAWGRREALEEIFEQTMREDFEAVALLVDYPRSEADAGPWEAAVDALLSASATTGRRAAVLSQFPESLPRAARERLQAGGVVPLQGLTDGVTALAAAASYAERRRALRTADETLILPAPLRRAGSGAPTALDEWDSKRILEAAGLTVPRGRLTDAAHAAAAAAEVGYPVAVKAVDPRLAHKSEQGALALGLRDGTAVEAAVRRMRGAVPAEGHDNDRFIVERMVEGAVAELIVGVTRHERFGLVLTIGSGGTLVEVLDDAVTLLLPTTAEAIDCALESLAAGALLDGYRGRPHGDRDAVVDAALAIADLAGRHPAPIVSLEVNPLLVLPRGSGTVAVDALVGLGRLASRPVGEQRWGPARHAPSRRTPMATADIAPGRVALVGTGVIGAGWAARLLARGLDVIATDPAPGAEARLRAAVARAWPALERLGLGAGASPDRLLFDNDLEAAVRAAGFVQESAPEREQLKREVLARIDAAAPPDALIASSSSGLLPSSIQSSCRNPQRVLVGHPFNPVYLLPLVEVVAGEATAPDAVDRAARFYRSIGMRPLRVRAEIEGYLSDRLQEALWRENLHLIADGVATTAELDDAIVYGPGLRWALMGVNLTFHLAGGDAGMRAMLEQFGPALELDWTKLASPPLTDELVERLVAGTRAQAAGRTVAELEQRRDDFLVRLLELLAEYWPPTATTAAPEGTDD